MGSTKDISVPSPSADLASMPDRIVNSSLMFAAISDQIDGGFLLVAGAILLVAGWRPSNRFGD